MASRMLYFLLHRAATHFDFHYSNIEAKVIYDYVVAVFLTVKYISSFVLCFVYCLVFLANILHSKYDCREVSCQASVTFAGVCFQQRVNTVVY